MGHVEDICSSVPCRPRLAEHLFHIVTIEVERHLNNLSETEQGILKVPRIEKIISFGIRAHKDNRIVTITVLDICIQTSIRVFISSN